MTLTLMVGGALLGATGGLLSIWLTALRAKAAIAGHRGLALATFPLVVVIAAAGVLVAAFLSPLAAWAAVPGLVVGRLLALHLLELSH